MARRLREYRKKRDFSKTREPVGETRRSTRGTRTRGSFVVQKHDASHLHYDFRLEIDGVMKSWAVPKGPSLDPADKRLAVEVEDHPIEYNRFEGTIPEGQYGGGTVMVWDRGSLTPEGSDGTPRDLAEGYRAGRIDFTLHGERLRGAFTLRRMTGAKESGKPRWILFKRTDAFAKPGFNVTETETTSVATGRTMDAIAHHDPAPKPSRVRPAVRARASSAETPVVEQLERIERDGGDGEVVFGDDTALAVTSLDKVFFPAPGVTKGALMRYYARVEPAIMPLLRDRPLAFKRFPEGVEGPSFYQHEPRNWPECARTARVRIENKSVRPRLIGGDLATLLYTVQLGAISAHPWHARVGSLASPDYLVLDLDPSPGVAFDRVVEVAQRIHEVLDAMGLEGHPKTSGASGLHVVVPFTKRTTWDASAKLAERIAHTVNQKAPRVTTLERSLAKRPAGSVYLDHLQNARGKTLVSAWSVRARPEATVSVPLDWSEVVSGLDPRDFSLDAALSRAPR